MQILTLDDPEWLSTFPRLVTPLAEEWLGGLLLRCDETNLWESGATLNLLKQVSNWGTNVEAPQLMVSAQFSFEDLAKWLASSVDKLLATTYLVELRRCQEVSQPLPGDLCSTFAFRLCPKCLVDRRLLKRKHMLSGVMCCLFHRTALMSTCTCGTNLQLFQLGSRPFACLTCGKDWAELPALRIAEDQVLYQEQLLSCYELFLAKGNIQMMDKVIRLFAYGAFSHRPSRYSSSEEEEENAPRRHRRGRRKGVLLHTPKRTSLSSFVNAVMHFDLFSYVSNLFQSSR
jgi:TniQ